MTNLPSASRFAIEKLVVTLLMIAVFAVGFFSLDRWNGAAMHASFLPLELPVDAHIPFLPAFVFAYLLYYPWLLVPACIIRERAAFYRAFRAFLLMQLSAYPTFLLLPSRMIRPAVDHETGFTGAALRWIYGVDHGFSVFPSLHVGHSMLIAILAWTYRRESFPIVASGTAAIVLSTVLIKQHYLIDLPAGALLAWLAFKVSGLSAASRSAIGARLASFRPASRRV